MIQTYQNILSGLKGSDLFILIAFIIIFMLRFIYLMLFTGRIIFRKKQTINSEAKNPISLIFTVRNEELNLKNNLPALLSFKDVDYEVVIVDDYSQDNTFLVLGMLKKQYSRLKISMLNEETRFSSKLAQNIALKAATNNWVLNVPINCESTGSTWLSDFEKELSGNKTVVFAYSGIENSNHFANHLFRIENFWLQLKSIGFTLNGIPFIYNDENVAFRKNEYFKIGGYGQKIKEPYANLELLINSFIRKKTTSILLSAQTAIRKSNTVKWNDYFDLLKKNIRVEKHLSNVKKLTLSIEELTRLLFLPLVIVVSIILPELWILIAILLTIKTVAHLFIIKTILKHLNEPKIFISSLAYDLLTPYFKLFYRWYFNRRNGKNKWRNKI